MKTKVTIIKDVENSQVKKGETGYIDGYATDLNEVMTELKYSMSAGDFQVFKERINTMLNA